MDCRRFDELLTPYLKSGDLTETEIREFKVHYLSCDRCWHEFEEQLKLMEIMDGKTLSDILGYEPQVDRTTELIEYAEAFIDLVRGHGQGRTKPNAVFAASQEQ